MSYNVGKLKIDFSLKREIFFVVLGALLGGIMMMLPGMVYGLFYENGNYYTIWLIFGHVIGVYSNFTILAGIAIHFITAFSIGIVLGIFLYKTGILEINKPLNGLFYGLFTGTVVFLLWSIPVQQLILNHATEKTIALMNPSMSQQNIVNNLQKNLITAFLQNLIRNLIFGITLGLTTSLLSIKLGKRFQCPKCHISFSKVDMIKKHLSKIHNERISPKKVVVLGGGFAGIEAIKKLQKAFEDDVDVDITLVNKDNFLLFTPMLHEVVSGMIETSHVAIPLRSFCKRARFVEADVEDIDLENKKISLKNGIVLGKGDDNTDRDPFYHFQIDYDYLLVSLGGETNYYGNEKIMQSSFSMKTLYDANTLRSHIITTLEQADTLDNDNPLDYARKRNLLTYVVVGGGFSGVETVGEINEFIRESVKQYYHNIDVNDVKIILVSSGDKILTEMEEPLGKFAMEQLKKTGVQIVLSNKVNDIIRSTSTNQQGSSNNSNSVGSYKNIDKSPLGSLIPIKIQSPVVDDTSLTAILNNDYRISTYTVIWTAGVIPESILQNISCEKDKKGRLATNEYLQAVGFDNVFAVGDCASVIDPVTGHPCPPTAQHAIRQGEVAGSNLVSLVEYDLTKRQYPLSKFDYKTRGTMATVGKRNGVAIIFGFKILGTVAWMIWRAFYLKKIPSRQNRLRVVIDWTVDLLFRRDIARLKSPIDLNRNKYVK
ncbi:MAG: NAD(P)/FAD-dependent oxidoreductase [Candidatus Nitrosocosmicus sp.]